MRKRLLVQVAISAMVAAFLAVPAIAQFEGQVQKRFDLTLQDADFVAATNMLSRESGLDLQFVFKPTNDPYPRITALALRDVTVDEALRYICEAVGAHFQKDPSGVYIIGRPGDFAPPAANGEANTGKPVPAPKIVTKIFLNNYSPREMIGLLFSEEVDRLGEWKALENFKRMHAASAIGHGLNPVVVNTPGYAAMPLQQPQAGTTSMYGPVHDFTGTGGGNEIMIPGGNNQALIGGGGGGGRGGGQLGGGGGQIGGGGGGLGFGGQGFGGQGLGQQLQGGEGFVPLGIDQIIYDPTDNSIIVRGDDAAIEQLERIIAQFDVAPEQVIIKVEFITTSNSETRNFGIDWLFQRGQMFLGNVPGTMARAGDPFFVNIASGNLTTRLRMLLLEGYGTVVNAPMIRTLNNQPAFILQQIQTWIILNQLISVGGGQVISAPTLFPINVQSGLSVQPRINRNRTITMTISPQIAEFGEIRRAPDGTEVPDILSQTIFVTAIVRNGETIVLGGLTRKMETFTVQRFPVLSDLPFIGNLFRSTSRGVSNQELLVFITPTIVEDDDPGIR